MRNIRLLLEYDGTCFAGWQVQAQARTVQGELARALKILLGEELYPVGAGRTDAGTHALGQVAHFRTGSEMPLERLHRGLNGLLPPDVAVRQVDEAPPEFHARYSALSKRYAYRIHLSKAALNRSQVWSYHRSLDLDALVQAASLVPGTHSFGAFCKQDPVPRNLLCQVTHCAWTRRETELVLEIEADRFLRHMVRILVGTLVDIGRGARPVQDMAALLASNDRTQASFTAPSCGLCLLWVRYPGDD